MTATTCPECGRTLTTRRKLKYQLALGAILIAAVFATFYIHDHGGFKRYSYYGGTGLAAKKWGRDWESRCRWVNNVEAGHPRSYDKTWLKCPNYPWPVAGP